MKLIATVKLNPTEQQATALKTTLERANDACNLISEKVWETQILSRYKIQRLCYLDFGKLRKRSARRA